MGSYVGVIISEEEYKNLLDKSDKYMRLSGKVEAFANYVNIYGFSVDRKVCGAILGFEVKNIENQ